MLWGIMKVLVRHYISAVHLPSLIIGKKKEKRGKQQGGANCFIGYLTIFNGEKVQSVKFKNYTT